MIRLPRWQVLAATAAIAVAALAVGAAAVRVSAPAAHSVADNGILSGDD